MQPRLTDVQLKTGEIWAGDPGCSACNSHPKNMAALVAARTPGLRKVMFYYKCHRHCGIVQRCQHQNSWYGGWQLPKPHIARPVSIGAAAYLVTAVQPYQLGMKLEETNMLPKPVTEMPNPFYIYIYNLIIIIIIFIFNDFNGCTCLSFGIFFDPLSDTPGLGRPDAGAARSVSTASRKHIAAPWTHRKLGAESRGQTSLTPRSSAKPIQKMVI